MALHSRPTTALVTGANSGVGFELTKRLLGDGWNVIALIRSPFSTDEPLIMRTRADNRLRVYQADLSDFGSLKHALQEINAREEQIDVLFNNAGAAVNGIHASPQGREMHFEVNTVVPYIIVMELKSLLEKGTLKTIVNTSSNALLFVRQFNFDILEHPRAYKPIVGPYGASKLALSLWTQTLAPALLADGIEIRSVNPGANKTKMTSRADFPKWMVPMRYLFFSHPSVGAARLYDVAVGAWRGTIGIFVNNKARSLPFADQGPAVLEHVNAIYEREFATTETVASSGIKVPG